jgi:septal ring factor EnvC (AmiA/AmiB activator)
MAEVYSSLYKGNVHVTTPFKSTHKAIDLGNYKTKNPIYSPNKLGDGTVSYVATSYTDSAGKVWSNSLVVYIKYDNGMTSRMFHGYVADRVVSKGQRVSVGQQVYKTGNTGNSTGDHLHYVLLNSGGVAIDPAPYVLSDQVVTPPPTECEKEVQRLTEVNKGLTEALGASQGVLENKVVELATANERVKFLEDTMLQREKELNELQGDYDRVLGERNNFEKQYTEVVTELNELKAGRDTWINRLADIIHKLFSMGK